jgi:purine-binding chemotaxis protein CheW
MVEKNDKIFNSLQVVCFRIGTEEYGIDILQVQEILKVPKITTLPKSLPFILGVIDLRGKVIPVIDLSLKFGLKNAEKSERNRTIVVDIAGKKVGLLIDSVSHVIKVDQGDVEPPPPVVKGISGKYIVGIAKRENGFIVILDIRKIFSTDEIAHL